MALDLLKKVKDIINRYNMLKHGDTVLVGVSSGPDSVCLLYVLKELQEEYNLSLHIAHLNHGFRGNEAEEDVQFVQSLGKSLGIPLHIEYADIPFYIKKTGLSKQAGAREYRYKFFNRIADKISATRIALGHTADDQAETFLMRLLRGSGSSGLSGIPPVRDRIIRPLIEITRGEINEFLSEREIRYRIDSSNLTTVYLRNKIRLELIPYLSREFNPNIMDTLNRNLKILRDEDIFLDEYVKNIYQDMAIGDNEESVRFDAARLSGLPVPVKRRILRLAVETISGEGAVDLSLKHVEDSLNLLDNERGGEVHLPAGIIVKRDKESFRVYLKTEETHPQPYSYNVAIPGDTLIPEAGIMFSATILDKEGYKRTASFDEKYEACFSIGDMPMSLIIRNRRSGDLFYPKGMNGRKKIKEYFIDMKITREERDMVPILDSPEGIMWIVGFRTDERFKVSPSTEKILHVRAFRNAA